MKSLLLIALMAVPATAFAVEDAERNEAYKQRRADRRAYALEARREYNARKGPHVYRTAIAVPAPITPFLAIEKGWVYQPPIPVRPIIGWGGYDSYHYVAPVHHGHYPQGQGQLAYQSRVK
jgi:hypothetical protein